MYHTITLLCLPILRNKVFVSQSRLSPSPEWKDSFLTAFLLPRINSTHSWSYSPRRSSLGQSSTFKPSWKVTDVMNKCDTVKEKCRQPTNSFFFFFDVTNTLRYFLSLSLSPHPEKVCRATNCKLFHISLIQTQLLALSVPKRFHFIPSHLTISLIIWDLVYNKFVDWHDTHTSTILSLFVLWGADDTFFKDNPTRGE